MKQAEEHESSQQHFLINNNSYLSIGIVVLIVAAALWLRDGQASAATMAATTATELLHYKEVSKLNAEMLSTKIDALSELLKAAASDRFTGKDHKIFVERLKELNPDLKIPQPP